jgi:glucose-1-phosphate cytidylyltransferase
MKVVILAGGLGSRLSEETGTRPKPMVEIGGYPIIWHIMKSYSAYGLNNFIICLGYKGYMFKEYFYHYALHMSDVTIRIHEGIEFHRKAADPWSISLVDTGENSMTGGRLRRIKHLVKDDEAFCMTYGDGLSNVNIEALMKFHKSHGKLATVTAVRPMARFGALQIQDNLVESFIEKPESEGALINGGFFVLSPKALDLIDNDQMPWETLPLERLAAAGELAAFEHSGFWQPMDTIRDKAILQEHWSSGKAPWKVWE